MDSVRNQVGVHYSTLGFSLDDDRFEDAGVINFATLESLNAEELAFERWVPSVP
jgi:hypothetical protein